jgi:hypothetical protein
MSTAMPNSLALGAGRAKTSSDERAARDVQHRRLAGLLGRRGFDSAVITRVLSNTAGVSS